MARKSKRSLEGELFIDHRSSPGLPPEFAAFMGLDPKHLEKGAVVESPIVCCSHCQATVVLRPDRSRPRAYCAQCDKYICDECAFIMHRTLECRNFERRLDVLQNQIDKFGSEFGVSPLLLAGL